MFSYQMSSKAAQLAKIIVDELNLPVGKFSTMKEHDFNPYQDKLKKRIDGLANLSQKEKFNILAWVCDYINNTNDFYSHIACHYVAFRLRHTLETQIYGSFGTYEAKCDRESINSPAPQ